MPQGHSSKVLKSLKAAADKKSVHCPQCNNVMVYMQSCHLRCQTCGAELSCEDKGWFWG